MFDPITKADLQSAVEGAIRETAPLVDANRVLLQWLSQNGIEMFDTRHGVWLFQDNRPGSEGFNLDEDIRTTYADALIFALEFVKKHIYEQAIAERIKES